jgi:ferredoxin
MHRVHFRKENVTVDVVDGTNLRKACIDSGIDPYPALGGMLSCRGKGFCGTCVVLVDDPTQLSAPSAREVRYLKRFEPELGKSLRLSCQASVRGPLVVETDPDKQDGWRQHGYYSGRFVPSWKSPS